MLHTTAATFGAIAQCLSIIHRFFILFYYLFFSPFSFLAFRRITMMCQKSLVTFRCAQLLQIWVSCVVTGTLVWLGEAYPLGVRIGAPALSRSCWHSRLLSVSSFPESLDTHPVSANDSTPSSPTSSQIPGKFQDPVLCTSAVCVLGEGRS